MKRSTARRAAGALALCLALPLGAPRAFAEADAATVALDGDLSALPAGVSAQDGVVTVSAAGVYTFTGEMEGRLVVDAGKKDEVTLVLDGASIHHATESALFVKNAKSVTIRLAAGSENRVQSGETAALDGSAIREDAQDGAITAKDDLTIEGEGALFVGGYLNNGIHATNDLTLAGGSVTVEAVHNGIKGKDALTLAGGDWTVTAGGDALTSDADDGEGYGVVTLAGGTLRAESADDAVKAATQIAVTGGEIELIAGGGSANAPARQDERFGMRGGFGMGDPGMRAGKHGGRGRDAADGEALATPPEAMPEGMQAEPPQGVPDRMPGDKPEDMQVEPPQDMPEAAPEDVPGAPVALEQEEAEPSGAKGLNAGTALTVTGGALTVDAADDALHSNGSVEIAGGALTLSAGDDGVHADESLTVSDGTLRVLASYEGLEANQIDIAGGDVEVAATDDGVNANGGQVSWGRRAPATWDEETDGEMPNLIVRGGTLYVDAQGDGLDSNGNLLVEGGVVVVDGPSSSGNGALDVGAEAGGACEVRGGTVLAIGSAGMSETFGDRSTQVSFQHRFAQTLPAGAEITIAAADGTTLFSHTSRRSFSSLVFSCPALSVGDTVTLTAGGESETLMLESVSNSEDGFGGFRR